MSETNKQKKTLKETSQETKIDIKKVNVVIQLLVKKNKKTIKLLIYYIELKSNYIHLLLDFLF